MLSPVLLTRNAGALQRVAVTRIVAKAFCKCFWNGADDDDDPCKDVLVVDFAVPVFLLLVNQRGDLPAESCCNGAKPTTTALFNPATRRAVATTPSEPEIRMMDLFFPCARADRGEDKRIFSFFKGTMQQGVRVGTEGAALADL